MGARWTTGTFSGSHTFRLVGTRTAAGGNDFGLDDIRVVATPVPEPFTLGFAGLALAAAARRRVRRLA